MALESHTRRRILVGLAVAWPSRSTAAEPKVVIPPYNTVSDKEEILLGETFADKLAADLHLLEDEAVNRYADRIVQRLAETCRRTDIPYRIQVVDTAEVNAFALPGGRLFLNRGLLEWAKSEGELAAVLAHEVGHVVGRHGINQVMRFAMAKNLFEELKTAVGLNQAALSQVIDMLGGPAVLLAQLHYSREAESEADLLGAYNMQRAGWAPRHAETMLQRLGGGKSGSSSSPAGLVDEIFSVLSDHPTSASRAASVRRELGRMPTEGADDVLGEFAEIQERCRSLPSSPPPKKPR